MNVRKKHNRNKQIKNGFEEAQENWKALGELRPPLRQVISASLLNSPMCSALASTSLMHCFACLRPACLIVGRHIGSGTARWLPQEP